MSDDRQGEVAEALACCERALALNPNCAKAHHDLGNLLMAQGKVTYAVAHYRRAISLKPDFAEAHFALAHATTFFRDPDVFACLEKRMRRRLNEAASARSSLRIWVPGCSTGQEVYSLAILICEQLAGMTAAPSVELIGTDANAGVLDQAQEGYYPGQPPTTLSDQRFRRFFAATAGGFRTCDLIRQMCRFSVHDLAKAANG